MSLLCSRLFFFVNFRSLRTAFSQPMLPRLQKFSGEILSKRIEWTRPSAIGASGYP